jgi:integrase/recombinase XerD
MNVIAEARDRKVTIRQVWEAYRNGKLDATPMQRCTLGDAITETMKWRRGENLRERYLKELEAYLRRFAFGRTEMFMDSIGVAQIQEWFDSRNEALSTKRANMGRLGSMFDVAWKQGYIKENPCLKLPTLKIRKEAPTVFTPAQMRAMLNEAHQRRKQTPAMLSYLVLGSFIGIRPEEMEKLTWGDIDMTHNTVRVDVATSKVSKRRITPIHPPAKEWLKLVKRGAADELVLPAEITLKRYRRKLRDAASLGKWHQDIMRHSAASYLLALHGDAGKVALWLGNSARTLERDYKQLVNATDCADFWKLTPGEVLKNGGAK